MMRHLSLTPSISLSPPLLSHRAQYSSYELTWKKTSTGWTPGSTTTALGKFDQTWSLATYQSNAGSQEGASGAMCGKTDGSTLLGAIEQFPRCNVCTSFGTSDYRKAVCSSGKVIVKKYSNSLCTSASTTHATYSSNKCYMTDSNGWGSPAGLSFGLFDCGAPFPSALSCSNVDGTTEYTLAQQLGALACLCCIIATPIICCCICCMGGITYVHSLHHSLFSPITVSIYRSLCLSVHLSLARVSPYPSATSHQHLTQVHSPWLASFPSSSSQRHHCNRLLREQIEQIE